MGRRSFIGGSEVAALFGLHPHLTPFELWHRKAGSLPEPDLSDSAAVQAGIFLEPAVAAWVADRTGWKIQKVRRHLVHSDLPFLAGSLDYEVVGHDRGAGVLEIKTTDSFVARMWDEGDPPMHYELQLQTYLGITGRAWGAIAVLVGGNDLRLFERERRPKTIEKIEAAAAAFWASVREGREPTPDFRVDADVIAALYRSAQRGKMVDLTGDNYLSDLCARWIDSGERMRAAEAEREAIKAELLTKIGDASIAMCGDHKISAAEVAPSPDKTVTADMVGSVLKGRSGYRRFTISTAKKAKEAA